MVSTVDGIAVHVCAAKQDERSDHGQAATEQQRATALAVPFIDAAQRIAECRDTHPRHQRIGHENYKSRTIDDGALRVQQHPQRMRRTHAVEQIVAGDHGHTDHHEHRDLIVDVELKAKAADDGELEHDQPHATQEQETRQLRRGTASPCEERARAGEQEERRRAQVRDPPCQEERHCRLREVDWIDTGHSKVVAHVIERHQNHDDAAQCVDGGQPGGPGAGRVRHEEARRLPMKLRNQSLSSASRRRAVLLFCAEPSE